MELWGLADNYSDKTGRFEKENPFTVVWEAESGEAALPRILELSPDLVVTGVRFGGQVMSGIELIGWIQEQRENTR